VRLSFKVTIILTMILVNEQHESLSVVMLNISTNLQNVLILQ